jgi:hypothetical protein
MSLRSRLGALRKDVAQAERDAKLLPLWKREEAKTHAALAAQESASHVLPRKGMDYSFARPTIAVVREGGFTFACRYLTGGGKALSPQEVKGLSLEDVAIVSIYEESATAMLGGFNAGMHDGDAALNAAHRIGMPKGRPVYFACDFDMQPDQEEECLQYLKGASHGLRGNYAVGGYGGLRFVRAAQKAGVHFLWQTLAWSGGLWLPQAQLRQTGVGAEIDTDYAYASDFGQWRL